MERERKCKLFFRTKTSHSTIWISVHGCVSVKDGRRKKKQRGRESKKIVRTSRKCKEKWPSRWALLRMLNKPLKSNICRKWDEEKQAREIFIMNNPVWSHLHLESVSASNRDRTTGIDKFDQKVFFFLMFTKISTSHPVCPSFKHQHSISPSLRRPHINTHTYKKTWQIQRPLGAAKSGNILDKARKVPLKNFGDSEPSDLNPFTATGYFDIPPPRWPTFLVTLFPILKEGMGLSLLDEFEVQYHVIKK